jgi:hypothetical protein
VPVRVDCGLANWREEPLLRMQPQLESAARIICRARLAVPRIIDNR